MRRVVPVACASDCLRILLEGRREDEALLARSDRRYEHIQLTVERLVSLLPNEGLVIERG